MRIVFFILLLTAFKGFGQDIFEVNKSLGLSENLEYEREIRIYKDFQDNNNVEIFRMYDKGNNNWKVEISYYAKDYKQCTKKDVIDFPKESAANPKPRDPQLIWFNMLLADIEYLPNLQDIKYKLKNSTIEKIDGKNTLLKKVKTVPNVFSYSIFVRNVKVNNYFVFNDPEKYFDLFPDVNELVSFNKLLSVIRNEFNIWKN